MTIEELYSIIAEHDLCIRRIPDKVVSHFEPRHFRPGDELVTYTYKSGQVREFAKRTTVPKMAGVWLVLRVSDTGAITRWDNAIRGKSLEEAIANYIEGLQAPGTYNIIQR